MKKTGYGNHLFFFNRFYFLRTAVFFFKKKIMQLICIKKKEKDQHVFSFLKKYVLFKKLRNDFSLFF